MMRWATFALLGSFSFSGAAAAAAPPALVSPAAALAQLHDCTLQLHPGAAGSNNSASLLGAGSSVHELTPGDIEVVMAMGDGIVAGLGINGTMDEMRGLSFAMGAEDLALTLPNMLQQVQRESSVIAGASKGFHRMEAVGRRNYRAKIDGLNAAQSKAFSKDMVDQVDYLVDTLSELSAEAGKDYMQSSWKVLTMQVGVSDACHSCKAEFSEEMSADSFEENIEKALTKIRKSIPKVFVNVLPLPGFQRIRDFEGEDPYCGTVKEFMGTCPCLHNSTIDLKREEYNQRLEKLATKFSSADESQFAVVLQPFTRDFRIPSLDYMSKFDCFHYSDLGHQAFASGLWNSMLTPVGSKSVTVDEFLTLKCPSESTNLFTAFTPLSS